MSSGPNAASSNPTEGVNIFQMDRNQLQNLHRTLWARQNPNDQLSARTLRIRATEWLLLNGLSTMHRFENWDEAKMDMDIGGSKIRGNLEDECNTCRQYRVGKSIPIYEEFAAMTRKNQNGQKANKKENNGQNVEIMGTPPGTGNATIYATNWENSFISNSNANCSSSFNSQNALLRNGNKMMIYSNGGNEQRRPPHISNLLFGCLWCRRD